MEAETHREKFLYVNMHPVCLTHITFYSIFQPAATKLNSAFLLTVNDIRDRMQLGWLAACYEWSWSENWKEKTERGRTVGEKLLLFLIKDLQSKSYMKTQSSPYLPASHFHILWLIICSRCRRTQAGHCDLFPDLCKFITHLGSV